MFLLVPAYPGCPGQTAVEWLLVVVTVYFVVVEQRMSAETSCADFTCAPIWRVDAPADTCMLCCRPFNVLCWRHHCRGCGIVSKQSYKSRTVPPTVIWGQIYKISHDLSYDCVKFVVRSTYGSDLQHQRAEIFLRNIIRTLSATILRFCK